MRKIIFLMIILITFAAVSFCQTDTAAPKQIAAICNVYYPNSHPDVLITRFMEGFPTDENLILPKVKIISLYIEQYPANDVGKSRALKFGVPIYKSVREAMTCGTDKLAVDGVLYIGEHGKYGYNKYNERLYPHMFYMEQIYRILDEFSSSIPVYCDKQLAYSWLDSKWIYDRSKDLKSPLMAGSTLPLGWQLTKTNIPIDSEISEVAAVGNSKLNSYGFHVAELLQSIMERRKGGESGIESIQSFKGDAFYDAAKKKLFDMKLVEAACSAIRAKKSGTMKDNAKEPEAIVVNYKDGSRGVVLVTNDYYGSGWGFAAKVNGKIQASEVFLADPPFNHFSYLSLNIQEMFISGKSQIPVERTLYSSAMIDFGLRSLYEGGKQIKTTFIDVAYKPFTFEPIRPTLPNPITSPKEWSTVGQE